MVALKLQITELQAARLDELARKLDVPSDTLAASAIEAFLDRETWQISEIEAGLGEAQNGDFASEDEVAAVFAKFSGRT